LLEETNASGVAQADYIYLDGRPVAVLNGSTLYYLHDDMLGTPQLTTDSNQAIAWQASYDPFGEASVSGTITQNLRLPGQYFDVESGWNHNGFRDYAPTLGRYIEPDPLGRLGSGNNLYVYAADNPVNLADPLGLCPSNAPLSPQAQACENKIQGAVNSALNTNSTYLGPTVGPGMNSMGYRNGAYNFNFFAPGVTNPVAGSNGGSGRFPGSGLHIPLPGGADPTIMPWGYNAQAGGSYFTAHYDSANPTDDLVSFFEHIINDVILRRPHGC
jgi:RHS repeat-associated protein